MKIHLLRLALWLVLAILVVAPLIAIVAGAAAPQLLGFGVDAGNVLSTPLWHATINSIELGMAVTAIACVAGLSLALLMDKSPPPAARLWEGLLFLPFLMAPYLLGLAWSSMALPGSVFNRFLGAAAIPFGRFVFSFMGMAFIIATHLTPIIYLLVRGYLAGTGNRLEMAARVHGMGPVFSFLRITLPRLGMPLAAGALITFLAAIDEFGIPAVIGPYTGITVLTTAIQSDLDVWPINLAGASRTAVILLALGIVAWGLYTHFERAGLIDYSSAPLRTQGNRRFSAGWLVVVWVGLTSLMPIGVIVLLSLMRADTVGFLWTNLTLQHFIALLRPGSNSFEALSTSAYLAFSSSVVSLLVASAIALLVRLGRPGDQWLDFVTTLLNAIPGIVLAVGLILVWNAPWNILPVYGYPAMLIVAYITVLMPLALRYAKVAVARIETGHLAAAQVHGVGTMYLMSRVVAPLMLPVLFGGFMITFSLAMRELVTSLLLQPPGVTTVSTFIFNQAQQGNEGEVMAMSVLSIVVTVGAIGMVRLTARVWRWRAGRSQEMLESLELG